MLLSSEGNIDQNEKTVTKTEIGRKDEDDCDFSQISKTSATANAWWSTLFDAHVAFKDKVRKLFMKRTRSLAKRSVAYPSNDETEHMLLIARFIMQIPDVCQIDAVKSGRHRVLTKEGLLWVLYRKARNAATVVNFHSAQVQLDDVISVFVESAATLGYKSLELEKVKEMMRWLCLLIAPENRRNSLVALFVFCADTHANAAALSTLFLELIAHFCQIELLTLLQFTAATFGLELRHSLFLQRTIATAIHCGAMRCGEEEFEAALVSALRKTESKQLTMDLERVFSNSGFQVDAELVVDSLENGVRRDMDSKLKAVEVSTKESECTVANDSANDSEVTMRFVSSDSGGANDMSHIPVTCAEDEDVAMLPVDSQSVADDLDTAMLQKDSAASTLSLSVSAPSKDSRSKKKGKAKSKSASKKKAKAKSKGASKKKQRRHKRGEAQSAVQPVADSQLDDASIDEATDNEFMPPLSLTQMLAHNSAIDAEPRRCSRLASKSGSVASAQRTANSRKRKRMELETDATETTPALKRRAVGGGVDTGHVSVPGTDSLQPMEDSILMPLAFGSNGEALVHVSDAGESEHSADGSRRMQPKRRGRRGRKRRGENSDAVDGGRNTVQMDGSKAVRSKRKDAAKRRKKQRTSSALPRDPFADDSDDDSHLSQLDLFATVSLLDALCSDKDDCKTEENAAAGHLQVAHDSAECSPKTELKEDSGGFQHGEDDSTLISALPMECTPLPKMPQRRTAVRTAQFGMTPFTRTGLKKLKVKELIPKLRKRGIKYGGKRKAQLVDTLLDAVQTERSESVTEMAADKSKVKVTAASKQASANSSNASSSRRKTRRKKEDSFKLRIAEKSKTKSPKKKGANASSVRSSAKTKRKKRTAQKQKQTKKKRRIGRRPVAESISDDVIENETEAVDAKGKVSFIGAPFKIAKSDSGKTDKFFKSVKLNGSVFKTGDVVYANGEGSEHWGDNVWIGRIWALFERKLANGTKKQLTQMRWFWRAEDLPSEVKRQLPKRYKVAKNELFESMRKDENSVRLISRIAAMYCKGQSPPKSARRKDFHVCNWWYKLENQQLIERVERCDDDSDTGNSE